MEHLGLGEANYSVTQVIVPRFAYFGLLDSARGRCGGLGRRLGLWWSHLKSAQTKHNLKTLAT